MSGDVRKTFEEAFGQYAESLFRYCSLRLSDRERAKELSQECFTKAWAYAMKGNDIANMRVFLFRIAHNLVVNEYRDKKKFLSLETLVEDGFDPEGEARTPEEEAELKRALGLLEKLPPPYRDVMVLRYVEDLPVKDIARIMGISETSVSVKIYRAKEKLQKLSERP